MNNRTQFLREFFGFAEANANYAVLKMIWDSIEDIPESSDIDLLIHKSDRDRFIQFSTKHPSVLQSHVQNKSFISFITLLFVDGTYLEIDLLFRFDRKGFTYLDAEELLRKGVTRKNGISLLKPIYSFEYIMLFYMLNDAAVPEKYREWFGQHSFEQRSEIFGHICGKYQVHLNTLDELYKPASRYKRKIKSFISSLSYNRKSLRFVHSLHYLVDMKSDLTQNKGVIITFSGVDGAGKSTVLENIKKVLHEKYRKKVIVLRHRPSLLPILSAWTKGRKYAELKATTTLPRQGTNTSNISSFLRFCYYYSDYLFGQLYVHLRYTRRGYIVLYDRYYFDFIVDSRRSNISLPKNLLKACYRFVLKPELNIFLYAPADEILRRKKELSISEIEKLTAEYKELFDGFGNKFNQKQYLSLNNLDLKSTLSTVEKHCLAATFSTN